MGIVVLLQRLALLMNFKENQSCKCPKDKLLLLEEAPLGAKSFLRTDVALVTAVSFVTGQWGQSHMTRDALLLCGGFSVFCCVCFVSKVAKTLESFFFHMSRVKEPIPICSRSTRDAGCLLH